MNIRAILCFCLCLSMHKMDYASMDRRCEFGTPKQFLYVLILVVGVLDSIAYTRRLGNPLISQVFLICLVNSGHVRVPAAMYQWMALTYTSIPNWYFMWVRQKVVQKQGNPPNKDTETLPNWAATSELWFHFSDHHFEHHWLSPMLHGTGFMYLHLP